MRIAILCQYFHPEIGAPSARLLSLARDFRAFGHEVVVITGFPNHPTGILPDKFKGLWTFEEDMEGVRVLRNWLYVTPNEGFVRKTISHLSFMVTAVILGAPRMGEIDVIIVSSPSFFAVISAWIISVFKRIPFVFEVRDLWPAVFVELGVLRNRLIIAALERLEMFLYARSDAIVTVTRSFEESLLCRGLPKNKVTTITNGVVLDDFKPGEGNAALRRELQAEGKFIVLYMGAHGISQALTAILRSARELGAQKDILFLFVGEGAEKRKLEGLAREWSLRNVRFLGSQPREAVLNFYRTADVCLIPLRDIPLFDAFIPSKMFEIMSCERPIIGSVRGEPASILEESGSCVVVPPEDSRAISAAVLRLKGDPVMRHEMGAHGRQFVTKHYQRRALAERYAGILERVTRQ